MPEAMDKPRVVVLTGAGSPPNPVFRLSAQRMDCGKNTELKMWRRRKVSPATRRWCRRSTTPAVASFSSRRLRRMRRTGAGKAGGGAGDRFLLVTQNIDNLHERAGNHNIIHMHGELLKVRCARWSGAGVERGRAGRRPLPLLSVPFASASACGLVWRNAAGNG